MFMFYPAVLVMACESWFRGTRSYVASVSLVEETSVYHVVRPRFVCFSYHSWSCDVGVLSVSSNVGKKIVFFCSSARCVVIVTSIVSFNNIKTVCFSLVQVRSVET